jgi:peptide/nickel transport system substrate-binding protein
MKATLKAIATARALMHATVLRASCRNLAIALEPWLGTQVEFAILGPIEARRNGTPLPLGGPKQRALLAILLLNANEPVSRDRLIAGLWGDEPPPSAPQSLDSYVSRLRRVLGADRIVRRAPGYLVVVEDSELDLERFERAVANARSSPQAADGLHEALALWRGPALADVLYEPFANYESQRLEQRRLAALEDRIDADLARGEGAELVPELDALVREHPLRERLLGQRMLALYRAGRQADALAAMQEARHGLAGELGIEPGPQLRELERRMLQQDPTLVGRRRRPTEAPRTRRRAALVACTIAAAAAAIAGALVGAGGGSPAAEAESMGNRAIAIDPATGRQTSTAELPGAPAAAVSAAGSVWIADPDDQLVLRVDPTTSEVIDRIPVDGQPGGLAAGGGAIWAASTIGGAVKRIDPATGSVTQTIPVGSANPGAIAYRADEVWVADTTSRALVVLDARSGATKATYSLDVRPTALATVDGSIWVAAHDDGVIAQVDPGTGRTLQVVRVGNGPSALAVAGGSLWVANSLDSTVSRIDPATASVLATIAVGSGPAALTAATRAVWVASQYSGTVVRIDTATNHVVRSIVVGGQPASVVMAGDRVWAAAGPSASAHRGGTLTLVSTQPISTIDPSLHFFVEPLQFGRLVYDTLVSFQVSPGPAGLRLVPDLAVALPSPSRGGTAYTFRLRRGIRYSDGRLVHAADFRRSIERLFRVGSSGAGYFAGVVGADRCRRDPKRCALADGIATDDRTGTVAFRLRAPDPDFLFKLTVFSYSAPIPPGVPDRDVGHAPVPGTGPYRVASFTSRGLSLVRNERFREWSHAAQPAGNPDVIAWRYAGSFDAAAAAVESGGGDWLYGLLTPARLPAIRLARPAQVHTNRSQIFDFIPLNTHARPFDDVRVRQAFNYAIDRQRIARMYGEGVAVPLCQVLLPGVPGHRPYCPYTHDLAKARALVTASRTRGARVDVWGTTDQVGTPRQLPAYAASVLRSLGYRVRLHLVPSARITPALRRRIQLSVDGDWLADYPAPSAYVPQFFGCHGGLSNGYVCDRKLERAMARATDLQLSDPRRAGAAWAAVDRRITDQALWVPTANVYAAELVSARLRNYQYHPVWGFIASAAWVR